MSECTRSDLQREKKRMGDIRIASFNISSQMHPNILQIHEQLKDYHIDVVGMQELDRFTRRNPVDMLTAFASQGVYPYDSFQKTIDFEGGEYGIGLLSAYEIKEETGGKLNSEGLSEARAWQRIVIDIHGKSAAIYNTHLTHEGKAARRKQLNEILTIMNQDSSVYKILTGDFNTDQEYSEIYPMLEAYVTANGYQDKWLDTYNLKNEEMKVYAIDNIIVSRNLEICHVDMVENTLSDHNMLYVDLKFSDV
ncbi:MAG: endonuclease/exonuclease/phosphatase family protein [Beduini sp.]|uniref:endonuclease/exonuclease/phosphatase family protein n=1 Tax=Beduini sp. TaxID=1922300 RepID=UPI0011C97F38